MDLGISGRRALVCGASRGLGMASAERLAQEGVDLVLVARGKRDLDEVAGRIRAETGRRVDVVVADLSCSRGRCEVLGACPDPDILIHSGGWPESHPDFREWTISHWQAALDAMMLSPIELITGVVDGMIARGFGRIVTVTSRFVKEPRIEHMLSISPRLGLAGFMNGIARTAIAHNVTANALLPGIFATNTQRAYAKALASAAGKPVEVIWKERRSTNAANRFGEPGEFAAACAFLCSAHAGFITGQNIVIDGGGYPGVF